VPGFMNWQTWFTQDEPGKLAVNGVVPKLSVVFIQFTKTSCSASDVHPLDRLERIQHQLKGRNRLERQRHASLLNERAVEPWP